MTIDVNDFDPRKYMELAIEVMRKSVQEPRSDKISPKVGVVLVMSDGTVDTACRGELRFGDHAEFTLLERKHQNSDLTGSILFTTLEPCAPGSRRDPKISCSERIVLAHIKKVWVGLEDPDPTVDRKGIKYLQDHGIEVHMFDRNLQQIIEEENLDFLVQAKERVGYAKQMKNLTLTDFEKPSERADLSDLSEEALLFYKERINFKEEIKSQFFMKKLYQKGILSKVKNKFVPTGIGLILFGKSPQDFYPQAVIKATIKYPNGKTDIEDFGGPLVLIPDKIETWWKRIIPSSIDRSSAQRKTIFDFPYEPIREAITNALAHRDYDINGATCHLEINDRTITVKSPGGPVEPITIEQLQKFSAPTLSRNPLIFSILAEVGIAERRGLGMETFTKIAKHYNLPLPQYSFANPYLALTFFRTTEAIKELYEIKETGKLNREEINGIIFIQGKKEVTKREYAEHFNISDKKAQRHLSKFSKLGVVRQEMKGPATVYVFQK